MNAENEKAFSGFYELCKTSIPEKDHPKIQDAYSLVCEVFGDTRWESGESIVVHSVDVAKVVVQEIGLGTDTIIAALLHNEYYQDYY